MNSMSDYISSFYVLSLCLILVLALATGFIWRTQWPTTPASGSFSIGKTDLSHAIFTQNDLVAQQLPAATLWYPVPDHIERNNKQASTAVVVYFSSWLGKHIDNQQLINELVSHGYAVISVAYGHEYDTISDHQIELVLNQLKLNMDFSVDNAYTAPQGRIKQRLTLRTTHALEIANWLSQSPSLPISYDANSLGIMGFSFGGSVAQEACQQSALYKAAVNLDGWLFGEALSHPASCPVLMMTDATSKPTQQQLESNDTTTRQIAQLNQTVFTRLENNELEHGSIRIKILSSIHSHFSDGRLSTLLRQSVGPARIPHKRAAQIVNHYVLSFFNSQLTKYPASPLLGATVYGPDIEFFGAATESLPQAKK